MRDRQLPPDARTTLAQNRFGSLAVLERTAPLTQKMRGGPARDRHEPKRERITEAVCPPPPPLTKPGGPAAPTFAARNGAIGHFDRKGPCDAERLASSQREPEMARLEIGRADVIDNPQPDR